MYVFCKCCKISIRNYYLRRHERTKKHIKNEQLYDNQLKNKMITVYDKLIQSNIIKMLVRNKKFKEISTQTDSNSLQINNYYINNNYFNNNYINNNQINNYHTYDGDLDSDTENIRKIYYHKKAKRRRERKLRKKKYNLELIIKTIKLVILYNICKKINMSNDNTQKALTTFSNDSKNIYNPFNEYKQNIDKPKPVYNSFKKLWDDEKNKAIHQYQV